MMAYFSNGLEQAYYAARYCSRCIHQDKDGGCPIMDAHFLYAYDLCNEKEPPGKVILDMLIPVDAQDDAGKCAMFSKS
jgi:hypothetical protein